MAKTMRVLSRSHTAVTLSEPMPDPEKPGLAPPLRSVVLEGNGAISTVDAEVYRSWAKGNPHHPLLRNGMLEEVGDDFEAPAETFGHEPALEAVVNDKDEAKLAKAGVVTDVPAGGLTSADMTPENGTEPGDDPGEPRRASQPGEGEEATGKRRGRAA